MLLLGLKYKLVEVISIKCVLARFASPRACLLLTLVDPLLVLIHDEFGSCRLALGLIREEIPLSSGIHEASIALRRPGPVDPLIGADPLGPPSPSPSDVSYLILVKDLLIEGVLIQVTSDVREDARVRFIVPEDIVP